MAASRVFALPELAEDIILRLHPEDILRLQCTCRALRDTINETPAIQELLFFMPASDIGLYYVERPRLPYSKQRPTIILNSMGRQWASLAANDIERKIIENPFLRLLIHDAPRRPGFRRPEASWRRMLVSQPPIKRLYVKNLDYHYGSPWSGIAITPGSNHSTAERGAMLEDLEAQAGSVASSSTICAPTCAGHGNDCITLDDLLTTFDRSPCHINGWSLWEPFKNWDQMRTVAKIPYSRAGEDFLEFELAEDGESDWLLWERLLRH
ncbi:hypothetical protein HII31_08319 [Pseudocercospora fuligena]|uniref:F-box domain-containing protein n=1 Tax=Pseudocercospora fuligena TaxID=685502 RepID=A0A8H6RI14_9PEZI|nr:hypothetical protein HII31_08319 [Pseudocercospora fuligena]